MPVVTHHPTDSPGTTLLKHEQELMIAHPHLSPGHVRQLVKEQHPDLWALHHQGIADPADAPTASTHGSPLGPSRPQVIVQSLADSRLCPRTRRELVGPAPSIATILVMLGIDVDYWCQRCVPELQRRWAKADARRAAREADMAIGLGGSGSNQAAVRSERSRRSWVTRRLRAGVKARGRLAMGDWPAEGKRGSTGLKPGLAAKSTSRGLDAPPL